MGFKIKPKIERYVPHKLESGSYAIADVKTGELRRKEDSYRILKFAFRSWAQHECKKLNQEEEDLS